MVNPVAFFCSRSSPGDVILRAQDWANARDAQSPPVTIVLARAAKGCRPPAPLGTAIRDAIAADLAKVINPFPETHRRTTAASAEARNRHILPLARTILIAHAAPGGKTEALAREALVQNLTVFTVPSLHNANLLEIGALILPTYT